MNQQISPIVKQLLIINILFFIAYFFLKDVARENFAMFFPYSQNFKIWQPLTYMFMHGGFMHLFFNMFALYSFGTMLENIFGSKKFLFFYISCGLGAILVHTLIDNYFFQNAISILIENNFSRLEILQTINQGKYNTEWANFIPVNDYQNFMSALSSPVLGASGAIYGLTVAFAYMFPNAPMMLMFIPFPVKAKYLISFFLFLDLFLGFKGQSIFGLGSTGIAHFAHLGGALFGFIMVWYWKKNSFNNNRLN